MTDSWPRPQPPADDSSDSLAGQALEVERALKALEALDAFRAEASALRAELKAARSSGFAGRRPGRRRPALRTGSGEVTEGTWRFVLETAFIIGAAAVAWAVHASRLGIILTLIGAWVVAAAFEALASRASRTPWPLPRPLPMVPPPPVRPVAAASPPPAPVEAAAPAPAQPEPEPVGGWPSRPELAESTSFEGIPTALPEPAEAELEPEWEPEPEPEPAAVDELVPEPPVEEAEEERAPEQPRFQWFRREAEPRGTPAPEPELPVFTSAEVEPDGGPSAGASAVLEERAALADAAPLPTRDRRRFAWLGLRRARSGPAEASEPATEFVPELEPDFEREPEPGAFSDSDPEPVPTEAEPVGAWAVAADVAFEPERTFEPEPQPEQPVFKDPEPSVFYPELEPDGGPATGAFAVLEEAATARENGVAPAPAPRRRLFRRGARV